MSHRHNQVRKDDPALDLVEHARNVVRGACELAADARSEMIATVGIAPSPGVSDRAIARNYLAACGERA